MSLANSLFWFAVGFVSGSYVGITMREPQKYAPVQAVNGRLRQMQLSAGVARNSWEAAYHRERNAPNTLLR